MKELIEYTGGAIYFEIVEISLALIGMILTIVNLFITLHKTDTLSKKLKIEIIICVICFVIISLHIGERLGRYLNILEFIAI